MSTRQGNTERAMLIDKFLPQADIVNQQSILIEGTPAEVYLALKGWTAAVSPWGRWLLRLRDLPNRLFRGKSVAVLEQKGVDLRPGEKADFFLVLAAEENREVVLGIVGKFWRLWGNLYPVDRVEDFVSFRQRGYAKAVTSFLLEPVGEQVTRLMNVTRVKGYGRSSRFLFSLYWLLIRPFHNLILKAILRRIKRTVEMTKSQFTSVPMHQFTNLPIPLLLGRGGLLGRVGAVRRGSQAAALDKRTARAGADGGGGGSLPSEGEA